jgi:hypothetical protein
MAYYRLVSNLRKFLKAGTSNSFRQIIKVLDSLILKYDIDAGKSIKSSTLLGNTVTDIPEAT